ncbi:hypothetical protein OAT97_00755 [Gammaproteobacteria bacterium]|nr:hypothetical protein [Gammaproteobacteria bacterium]
MNKHLIKLDDIVYECKQHIVYLNHASDKMSLFMPLTLASYQSLTADEVGYIDQFLFRFAKLQDTLGQKLFKQTLIMLGEYTETMPLIDILNKLEKLEIIELRSKWEDLSKIRNKLTHDYECLPNIAAAIINEVYDNLGLLIIFFERIYNYLIAKGILTDVAEA